MGPDPHVRDDAAPAAALGRGLRGAAATCWWRSRRTIRRVVAGYALASLGFGFARPGFTAGVVAGGRLEDQARVAGAIAAVNGINVVFAPAFMALYRANHAAPFLLNMALMLALLAYAFLEPALRNADPAPATRADATMATLERSDEGGA